MRVLIIGGSGFLGKHILQACLSGSFNAVIATENKAQIAPAPGLQIVPGGIKAVTIDLINHLNPDIVIHAARPVFPKLKRLGRILASYHAATLNNKLIKNLRKSKHRPPLIFASGTLCYGNNNRIVYEDALLNPISYARDYFRGEMPVLRHLKKGDYPIKILRFPWILGNGSWFKWFYLNSIAQNASIPSFGVGHNKMAILDVRDAAKLTMAHIDQAPFNRIYNIFGHSAIRQLEFNNLVAEVMNCNIKPFQGGLEKAADAAFNSSIEPGSLYPELLQDQSFISLKQSLKDIKAEII